MTCSLGIIKKTGTAGDSYDELKSKAVASITKVGATFTWTSTVAVGTIATSIQVTEIKNAINAAYDLTKTCSDTCTSDKSANYGDDGDNTYKSSNDYSNRTYYSQRSDDGDKSDDSSYHAG